MFFQGVLTIFLSLFLLPVGAENHNDTQTKLSQKVVQDSRIPLFLELFRTLNIQIEPSLEAMNEYAQKHWLRKPGEERWQMQESEHQRKISKIVSILKQLRMIDEVVPPKVNVEYAMVLGATVSRMQERMQYLIDLIESQKLVPKTIVVLTGDRPLDSKIEGEAVLFNDRFIDKKSSRPKVLPHNESDAARFIWDLLPKTQKIHAIPIMFVPTKMIKKGNNLVRPTTTDTIETWLKQQPKAGTILAISNNPYIPYQEETMKAPLIKAGWFKKGGSLSVAGEGGSENLEMSVLLDNVARYIYSILQTQKIELALK